MLSKSQLKKIIEFGTFVTICVSSMWFVRKVKITKSMLNNAYDTSIVDVYEPSQSEMNGDKQYFTTWVNASINESKDIFNKAASFFKFMIARRLLNIAQSDNKMLRKRAIEHLAGIELEQWQNSLIAHMCNADTAVGIARCIGYDNKFFFTPPRKYVKYTNQMLLHALKDYLLGLDKHHSHVCVKQIVQKLFKKANDVGRIIDHDHGFEELTIRTVSEEHIPLCLETVSHHAIFEKNAFDIIDNNGLDLLMEFHLRNEYNISISIALCNTIANISSLPIVEELYKTGWIRVLAMWLNHPDIRLCGPAAQALINLDKDDNEYKFTPNTYLLHPMHRTSEHIAADVVFVHGLLGNVFHTWRNNTNSDSPINLIGKKGPKKEGVGLDFGKTMEEKGSSDPVIQEYFEEMEERSKVEWDSIGQDFEFVFYDIPENTNSEADGPYSTTTPKDNTLIPTQCWAKDWLPADCGHLRVIGVNYDTTLSVWAQMCPELCKDTSLEFRSKELLKWMISAGVGERPIIWVTHSMGGILVKNILSMAMESEQPDLQNLCLNTKAIVFYGTPHFGSKTATINQPASYVIWPSTEVQELREGSPNLGRIHTNFLSILQSVPIKVISMVENKPTLVSALKWNISPVVPSSGNPGVGEYYEIPQNHLGICKPTNRWSFLYQKVVQVIKQVVEEN